MLRRRLTLSLLILLAPGVVLAPAWPLAGLGAGEDDVLYYYPARSLFHDSVQNGAIPWINPWNGLGRPVAADPQQALWYPFTWLFAVLPTPIAYGLSLYAHYCLALWGMYRLLRAHQAHPYAAMFGALTFALGGFMLAHRAHFAMQNAAAWLPWVFWRTERATQSGGGRRIALAALAAALQVLAGHVQIAALTALGSAIYLLAGRVGPLRRWFAVWLAAGGLCALQIIPTFIYLRECTRTERGFIDFVENSWSPASAVGWVLPMLFGQRTPNLFEQPYWGPSHQCEQFSYLGIAPLILAAAALRSGWHTARRRGWAVLLVFALLTALGEYGPICPLLYWFPGGHLFRVPARALLLFQLSVAALSAGALDDLLQRVSPLRVQLRAVIQRWTRQPTLNGALLALVPVVAVSLCIPLLPTAFRATAAASVWPLTPAVFLPIAFCAASMWLLRAAGREWNGPRIGPAMIAMLMIDLSVVGWTIDVPSRALSQPGRYSYREYLQSDERRAWISALKADCRRDPPIRPADDDQSSYEMCRARVWVATRRHVLPPLEKEMPGEYVLPLDKASSNFNSRVPIASLTDYGPLQPRAFAAEFGFKPWGESLKMNELLADTRWMPRFGVAWILLCESDLPAPADCRLIAKTPSGLRLYRHPGPAAVAYFANANATGTIQVVEQSPERFTTIAKNTGGDTVRIVVEKAAISGWRAVASGHDLHVVAEGPLLAVDAPASAATIEWEYQPAGLTAGMMISGLTVMLLCVGCLRSGR